MPDYTADIEYAAPDFGRAEFRMLRRQLVPLLDGQDEIRTVVAHRPSRTIRARAVVSAPSSSSAHARASALARAVQAHLVKVRLSRVGLHVTLRDDQARSG